MSQSVEDGYETVELTDDHLDSICGGENISVGGWIFGNSVSPDVDGFIDTLSIERLKDGQDLKWTNKGLRVVYADDQDDSDQTAREIAEDIVNKTRQETNDVSTMDFSTVDEPHTDTDMKAIDDADRETVTMEVTMDISDMDDTDKEVICELARQYEDSFQEVTEKSRDYSWSFLTTGTKLAQSEGTPFESATRCQAFSLLTRIGDKHERLIENVYGDGAAAVSDEADVTAQEAANYYQLLAFVLGNPNLSQKASDA